LISTGYGLTSGSFFYSGFTSCGTDFASTFGASIGLAAAGAFGAS